MSEALKSIQRLSICIAVASLQDFKGGIMFSNGRIMQMKIASLLRSPLLTSPDSKETVERS